MSLTIRSAETTEEIAQVRALMSAYGAYLAANPSGAASINVDGYETELDALPGPYVRPAGVLLLAADGDRGAACVAFKPIEPALETDPGERACEMKRLWVDPAFRGHRLGRRLIEEGIAWARTAGYTAMYLDTAPAAMPEANALYGLLGFEQVPRYNDNPVPDIVFYRLRLS
ncbi:GNAT family N-acetyltransferase [Granulicella sibirica]|uniref:Acetyltransferase n=1 Tax=Granulicella sibirica TaxID=2479048 RepID=A0A4Q0T4P7_9BACT|nr:GNAT family N-acetyltransferase [Granulicella sibirica]RXH57550.1 acetyltransferase [Granulicella sibirica]